MKAAATIYSIKPLKWKRANAIRYEVILPFNGGHIGVYQNLETKIWSWHYGGYPIAFGRDIGTLAETKAKAEEWYQGELAKFLKVVTP